MKRSEKTTSIRFNSDIDSKLAWLKEEEESVSKRMGVRPRNRTQIIEEAVKLYYFKKINETQDADVVERVNELIADHIGAAMNRIINDIEEILFLAIKNDLGNKVFYRSPSVLPAPESRQEAIDVITEEESRWDMALEEYMHSKWKSEDVHMHVITEDDEDEEEDE
jgi:methionyl-tRNA synthetase